MAGRSPGRLTANPPETSSTSVMVSRRKAGVGGDEVAGELAEQEAGLPQRRRDHHGKAALQNRPGGLERGHCALAALSRRIEEQSRRHGEQHIALPGIERQPGDALRPRRWDRRAWRTELVSELRESCGARPARA